MSNHAHRRPLSRLGRYTGGPRAKHPHRRLLTRLYWARERMAAAAAAELAEIEAEEGDSFDMDRFAEPKVIWGAGCGPMAQRVDRARVAIELAGLATERDPIQGVKPRRFWRRRETT